MKYVLRKQFVISGDNIRTNKGKVLKPVKGD